MAMYDELVKKLRYCGNAVSCLHCPYWAGCGGSKEDLMQAADVIEEMQKCIDGIEADNDSLCKQIEELRKAVLRLEDEGGLYDELPTFYIYPTKWISVKERLPEETGKYLVCGRWKGKQTEIWVCEFMTLGCLKGWANNVANPGVSHWMLLPDPPKDGE